MNGWLGEVQGLKSSLEAATKKLVSLDRMRAARPTMPGLRGDPGDGSASSRTRRGASATPAPSWPAAAAAAPRVTWPAPNKRPADESLG